MCPRTICHDFVGEDGGHGHRCHGLRGSLTHWVVQHDLQQPPRSPSLLAHYVAQLRKRARIGQGAQQSIRDVDEET